MKLDMKTMIIAGAVVLAMAGEAVVMMMMMPGKPTSAAGDTADAASDVDEAKDSAAVTMEEPIGEFKCTNNQDESNLHLRFKIEAVVLKSKEHEFRAAVTAKKARIRHAVEKIIRGANRDALNDPELNHLKRQIREDVNKVLEKTYISEAVIHDFSMIEQ